jgi:hypothetical protein
MADGDDSRVSKRQKIQKFWEGFKVKKFFALFLAVSMMVMCLAGAASAKVRKFGFIRCSVDVPNGWTVEEDRENYTVGLTAPDASAAVSLSGFEDAGMSLEEAAEQMSEEMNGTKPERKSGNSFAFTYENENGIAGRASVSGDEKFMVVITVTGEHGDVDKIIDSLEGLE